MRQECRNKKTIYLDLAEILTKGYHLELRKVVDYKDLFTVAFQYFKKRGYKKESDILHRRIVIGQWGTV